MNERGARRKVNDLRSVALGRGWVTAHSRLMPGAIVAVRVRTLADVLTRLQVRYTEVQVVFVDTRAFTEDWTYRLLAARWRMRTLRFWPER